MSAIDSIDATKAGSALPAGQARAPADASTELAKLQSQLSEWADCPSGKTSTGKAHIADITGQIDAIKVQVKKAAVQSPPHAASAQPAADVDAAGPRIRLDGLGTNLNVQA